MLHRRSFTLALTCLALSFTTACSKCSNTPAANSTPANKEEYIQALDAICKKSDQDSDAYGKQVGMEMAKPGANQKELFLSMMEKGLVMDQELLGQLKKIQTPAQDNAAMEEIWSQQLKVFEATRGYADVLKRGLSVSQDSPQEERDALVADGARAQQEMNAESDKLTALAKKFGFHVCFDLSKTDSKK